MKKYLSFLILSLFTFVVIGMAQSKAHTVNGKVTSFEESVALEGVSIKVKGTKYLTGTQADGTFSLDITDTKQVLVVELQDYDTQEITICDKKELDIVLKRKTGNAQQ